MDMPLVVQTEELEAEPAAWLAERCRLVVCSFEQRARFGELLAEAKGLVIRTYTRVDDAMLAAAPNLKVVGRAGVGLDNVDLEACARRGVSVVYTPDANTVAVVEYVMALIFDAARPRLFLEQPVPKAEWAKIRRELTARRQLNEQTLGIYGMGRIGQRVARAAAGLDMNIIYHDLIEIAPDRRSGATPVGREELLRRSDILTVHVDGRPGNRGLIGPEAVKLLQPEVVLINASRGAMVDSFAVAEFMLANPGATAMLDVHEPEPIEAANPLLEILNVHLSPHLAAGTETAHLNMSWVVRDVWRVLSDEKPMFPATVI